MGEPDRFQPAVRFYPPPQPIMLNIIRQDQLHLRIDGKGEPEADTGPAPQNPSQSQRSPPAEEIGAIGMSPRRRGRPTPGTPCGLGCQSGAP